jgi:hypothetical protein
MPGGILFGMLRVHMTFVNTVGLPWYSLLCRRKVPHQLFMFACSFVLAQHLVVLCGGGCV